jgi:hypothetical protein
MSLTIHQLERLAFLEKRIRELADELALHHTVEENQTALQVVILDTDPETEASGWTPPRPDKFLTEHIRKLLNDYPGMLFHTNIHGWQVGYTLYREKIVFVPNALYDLYEKECLQAVGWSPSGEDAWEESISVEDEETGEVSTPDWPDPTRRQGVWKARQVAHWIGDTTTEELNYSVWANGTWG